MIRSSFSFICVATLRTCYQASLAIILSLWALSNRSAFNDELKWAFHSGALLPSSLMNYAESWRVFTAPLLHINLSHLLSNLILLTIANILQDLVKKTDFSGNFESKYKQIIVTHDWLSPIYLLIWGSFISSLRTIIGVDAWSVGLSGVAMMLVSKSCILLAAKTVQQQDIVTMSFNFSQRLFLCVAPWLLVLASIDKEIDFSSHVIGAATGSLYGFWLAKTSCSLIRGESEKI